MNTLLILGNQLFDVQLIPKELKITSVFMKEDLNLCTHFKYHKLKIAFFLSAMRKYAQELNEKKIAVHYEKLTKKDLSFSNSLKNYLSEKNITNLYCYEIEDKFFEKEISELCIKNKVLLHFIPSPMFLSSREDFRNYLSTTKKPFMKTFYERQRKKFKVLVDKDLKPEGGQWSFDEENRKPLPKNYQAPTLERYKADKIDQEVHLVVNHFFSKHPGNTDHTWLPTDRISAQKWLDIFIKERLEMFGAYEDALSKDSDIIHHSALTPFLNAGLLTPQEVVKKVLIEFKKKKLPLNSVEGFIRQVIGWREFIRGIYQNFSEKQDSTNFWNHHQSLTSHWYNGTTGIEPLDDVIKKTERLGYAHHIERLMIVGSLMLILEIDPFEGHKWFMEMFIDSSDWVMGPNVYGMALFSDGGIFATKPYFCGSNYYRKMGKYKTTDWQDGVDGLYWSFIEKNKNFFSKNPRMSMMVKTVEKMPADKKNRIYKAAEIIKNKITEKKKS